MLTMLLIAMPSTANGQYRYDRMLFACRSTDPTGTPLNRRRAPRGEVLGVLDSRHIFYLMGRDLRLPVMGYVPIYFSPPDQPTKEAPGGQRKPDGWVWKSFITCELSN